VIARQLAQRILEGENPRDVFAHIRRTSKPVPPMDQVDFDLEAEWEQDDPARHFEFPEDIEFVQQQIEDDNVWGWCATHVIAKWTDPETDEDYEGDDWLGGCSYHSREDFMQPGGYYDDMKAEAYRLLLADIERRWKPPEDED
jgi:hypothetical protein